MTNADTLHQTQIDVARALHRLCRDANADSVQMYWSSLAGTSHVRTTADDGAGGRRHVDFPRHLVELMTSLRTATYQPDKGAWLSAVVRVDRAGKYAFTYNYDRRPVWNSPTGDDTPPVDRPPRPGDQSFIEDLRLFPRAAAAVPQWYPREGATGDGPPAPARADERPRSPVFPPALDSLGADSLWVELAERVRAHSVAVVAEACAPHHGSREVEFLAQQVYERVFAEVLAPGTAAEVKRLWRPASLAAGFSPKSTDIPDGEQVASPSPELETLLEDVSDVLAMIIEHHVEPVD